MAIAIDESTGIGLSADTAGRIVAWRLPTEMLSAPTSPQPSRPPAIPEPTVAFEITETGAVYTLGLADKGKQRLVIAGGAFARLSVYDRLTGHPRTHLPLTGPLIASDGPTAIRDLAVVGNRGWVYAVTQKGQLIGFELDTGKRLVAEETGAAGAYSVAARAEAPPNTAVIAIGSADGSLTIFQHQQPGGLVRIRRHELGESIVYDASYVKLAGESEFAASTLVAGGSNGQIVKQSELDATPIALGTDPGQVFAIAVDGAGRRIITGGEASKLTVRDLATASIVAKIPGPGATVWSLALSHESRFIFAGDASGRITAWRLN